MSSSQAWYMRPYLWLGAISVLSLLLHIHIFTRPLVGPHVWRQTQTQTVILNFSRGSMNLLEPRYNNFNRGTDVQRMEFPIYQWLAAWCNRLLGENLLWSRLLNFLIGLWGILGVYRLLGTQTQDRLLPALGAWAFAWSPVFHYYTLNPMPDVLALSAMSWALYGIFQHHKTGTGRNLLLAGSMLSLATAAKLPFVLGGTVWLWLAMSRWKNQKASFYQLAAHAMIMGLLLLPAGIWYAIAIPTWKGNGIVGGAFTEGGGMKLYAEVIFGTISSHLPELLLNYGSVPFFLGGIWVLFRKQASFQGWNAGLIAFLAYFLYEIPMIGLVHDYYLLPFLPFLFYPVMVGIGYGLSLRNPWGVRGTIALLLLLPFLAFLRCRERWNTEKPRIPEGLFSGADSLKTVIPAGSLVLAGNDISTHIWLYQLDRKGFTFDAGMPDAEWLEMYIDKGVEYLVTDCADTSKPDIQLLIGKPLAASHGVRVYKLEP